MMASTTSQKAQQSEPGRRIQELDFHQLIHDLKNSLHGIRCGIDLLLNSSVTEKERREVLTIMKEEQQSARELIDVLSSSLKRNPDMLAKP